MEGVEGLPRPSTKVSLTCQQCGNAFLVPPSVVQHGRQFCSRECFQAFEAQRAVVVSCAYCSEPIQLMPNQMRRRQKWFCGAACQERASAIDRYTRFWSRVEITGDCWIWQGKHNGLGYGQFFVHGRHVYAHRYAYEELIGPIPEGLELDHLCRNPSCVRPDHLEAVDHRTNIRRGNSMFTGWWNKRKTHCPRGHPYDERNTYVDKRGIRSCRKCRYLSHRKWLLAKRAAIQELAA